MNGTTLNDILENENDDVVFEDDSNLNDEIDDVAPEETSDVSKTCVECNDNLSTIRCINCDDIFCESCYQQIHKSGNRKNHTKQSLQQLEIESSHGTNGAKVEPEIVYTEEELAKLATPINMGADSIDNVNQQLLNEVKSQCMFVPIRLSQDERELFKLLDSALNVSDYTNKIDIFSYTSKTKRIVAQLKEICSILSGLVISKNFKLGSELILNKNFKDNEKWFKRIFEIGRRYKILNPDKFVDNYGKLIYMIMDSRLPEIKSHLEFDLYMPVKTINEYIKTKSDTQTIERMFDDEMILTAIAEIVSRGKPRSQVQREIKIKEYAIEQLAKKYSSKNGFDAEEVKVILYSLGDFNAFKNFNETPIKRLLVRLKDFKTRDKEHDLSIRFGVNGARLSHDHQKQYEYILQSLNLWLVVMKEMIELWSLADDDLLNNGKYKLSETGQGLNRIKACPKLYSKMLGIVERVKRTSGFWIGSSYIHLGDSTVPNGLFFLDKYLQIPKILIPIDNCLVEIEDNFSKDKVLRSLVETNFESIDKLLSLILQDFFQNAFNGSGGNDFFTAGSCVDGRLTSTWEWANEIHKKSYFKFFLLSGFTGFN